MVLTAVLAAEEVLGSGADWHPEISGRAPRIRRARRRFMMREVSIGWG
jgi:hypothetical protein